MPGAGAPERGGVAHAVAPAKFARRVPLSDVDSFIREVTEEVRQDRMFRLWKKYAPYIIGAVLLVIAGAAALSWWNERKEQQARALGSLFLAADIGSVEAQERLLAEVEGPARLVAELRLAAAKALAGDAAASAALYREIAARPGLDPAYADLARLQAVRVAVAEMAPEAVRAELAPLMAEGRPYRLLAMELSAAVKLNTGDAEGAHAELRAILADPQATRGLRQRAQAMLVSSGGELSPEGG